MGGGVGVRERDKKQKTYLKISNSDQFKISLVSGNSIDERMFAYQINLGSCMDESEDE